MTGKRALRRALPQGFTRGHLALPAVEGGGQDLRMNSVLYRDRRAVQAIGRIDRGADQHEGLNRTLPAGFRSDLRIPLKCNSSEPHIVSSPSFNRTVVGVHPHVPHGAWRLIGRSRRPRGELPAPGAPGTGVAAFEGGATDSRPAEEASQPAGALPGCGHRARQGTGGEHGTGEAIRRCPWVQPTGLVACVGCVFGHVYNYVMLARASIYL